MKITHPIALALGVTLLLTCPGLRAAQVEVRNADADRSSGYLFRPDPGVRRWMGNYAPADANGGWYRTFAPGEERALTGGETYDVRLAEPSGEGRSGGTAAGGISRGTAYLYERNALGTLPRFDAGSARDQEELQTAIHQLEDHLDFVGERNRFVDLAASRFGGLAEARAPYTGSAVRVMYLTAREGAPYRAYPVYGKGPDVKEVVGKEVVGPFPLLLYTGPGEIAGLEQSGAYPGFFGATGGTVVNLTTVANDTTTNNQPGPPGPPGAPGSPLPPAAPTATPFATPTPGPPSGPGGPSPTPPTGPPISPTPPPQTNVPETGGTVLMLGLAFGGMVLLRRFLPGAASRRP